jgi:hypothetical protein
MAMPGREKWYDMRSCQSSSPNIPTLRRNDGVAIVHLGLCRVSRVFVTSCDDLLKGNALNLISYV